VCSAVADVTAYDPVFEAAGNEWNVDPQLLKAMAIQESGGNPRAVSKAGALGVMQIMPNTAKALGITDPTTRCSPSAQPNT
jgi:soluble lytic murein transglycosylase-like protein